MADTETQAPQPGFFRQLVTDSTGSADEAALAFLIGIIAIVILKSYSTIFPTHPFNAAEFSTGYASMLSLYNASKGVMRRLGNTPQ